MTNRHRSRIRTGASGAARDSSTPCAGRGCGGRYRIRYRTAFCSGCLGCPLPAVVLASLAELTSRPPHRTAGGGVVKSAPVPGNQVRERQPRQQRQKAKSRTTPIQGTKQQQQQPQQQLMRRAGGGRARCGCRECGGRGVRDVGGHGQRRLTRGPGGVAVRCGRRDRGPGRRGPRPATARGRAQAGGDRPPRPRARRRRHG